MNDFVLYRLRSALKVVRYDDVYQRRQMAFYRFCGYLDGLADGRVISSDEYRRLLDLAADALTTDVVSAA